MSVKFLMYRCCNILPYLIVTAKVIIIFDVRENEEAIITKKNLKSGLPKLQVRHTLYPTASLS